MFIDGFGISGYRSFGKEVQRIGPLKKINLFIGQNNSGKSNILLFLKHHYTSAIQCRGISLQEVDRHIGFDLDQPILEFALKIGSNSYKAILKKRKQTEDQGFAIQAIKRILMSGTLTNGSDLAWFSYKGAGPNALLPELLDKVYLEQILNPGEWNNVYSSLSGKSSDGDIRQSCIPLTLRLLSPAVNIESPKIDLVPAIRKVDNTAGQPEDYSGIGIIHRLAKLQNPRHDQLHIREQFRKINRFLQLVSEKPEAHIEIPYERDGINVHMDDKTLPLTSLGTGIHEVVIIAAAATVLENQVLCIEEPELHLHPRLQKQLVQYLKDKTNNQYFISTHSAHLLDTKDAAIFHVRLLNGCSVVELVSTDAERARICDDLGYHASDILQANCIIWVEGPSDRIYLNHWISAKDSTLVEGLHYSIMFYGGRLLSHLTANDPEVNDFISLRRLNRHIAIVIDSDRPKPKKRLSDTKMRVRAEFDKGPGFAWITKGREIENYIEPVTLENAIKSVHPSVTGLYHTDIFDNRLSPVKVNGRKQDFPVDKVKVAKEVAKNPANFDVLDLNEKIGKLVKFIYYSNGTKNI